MLSNIVSLMFKISQQLWAYLIFSEFVWTKILRLACNQPDQVGLYIVESKVEGTSLIIERKPLKIKLALECYAHLL